MKENLNTSDDESQWYPTCYWQSDATSDHLTEGFVKQGEVYGDSNGQRT